MVRLFAALVLLALAGFAQAPERTMGAADRAQCEARGGRVERAGRAQFEMCVIAFADAGRRCASGSQCAGDCRFERSSSLARRLAVGTRVAGQCQADSNPFGCNAHVEGGRLQGTRCVD